MPCIMILISHLSSSCIRLTSYAYYDEFSAWDHPPASPARPPSAVQIRAARMSNVIMKPDVPCMLRPVRVMPAWGVAETARSIARLRGSAVWGRLRECWIVCKRHCEVCDCSCHQACLRLLGPPPQPGPLTSLVPFILLPLPPVRIIPSPGVIFSSRFFRSPSSIRLSKMLSSLTRPFLAIPARQARLYSELASATSSAAIRSPPFDPLPPVAPHRPSSQAAGDLPYLIRRNTRGSIPVYTDIRNGGTKFLVLIRNVEGNVNALADDLTRSLFPAGSNEAERMKVHTVRQSHIVLGGGRWKNDVIRWLVQKGF